MPTIQMVREYLAKLPDAQTNRFDELEAVQQDKAVFSAHETLIDVYGSTLLNERAIGLQALYMIEGEEEEYARLKRHGASSLNAGGTSVNFTESGQIDIAPSVKAMLGGQPLKTSNSVGRVGWLV